MRKLNMLSNEQKSRICELVEQYCKQYGYNVLPIKFELKGVVAGTFTYKRNSPVRFNFNPILASKNFSEFLARTVPHECAHYIDFMENGSKQRTFPSGRRDMHGKYFKNIMQNLGAKDPSTYHTYDTSHVAKRRQRRWEYKCSCRTWEISTVMHNRIQKGEIRSCGDCKDSITKVNWTGKEIK